MAKLPKIDLSGVSTEKLVSMSDEELMKFTRQHLTGTNLTKEQYSKAVRQAFATITSRLVSASNKRIKRLGATEMGQNAPAYINYMKHAKFSVRGKSYSQLRNLFKVAKQFLGYKTSSVQGWNKVRREVEMRLGVMSKWKAKKFWKAYRELEELNGGFVDKSHQSKLSSDNIQRMLRNEISESGWRKKRGDIIDAVNEKIKETYEEEQNTDEEEFFDLLEELDSFD